LQFKHDGQLKIISDSDHYDDWYIPYSVDEDDENYADNVRIIGAIKWVGNGL